MSGRQTSGSLFYLLKVLLSKSTTLQRVRLLASTIHTSRTCPPFFINREKRLRGHRGIDGEGRKQETENGMSVGSASKVHQKNDHTKRAIAVQIIEALSELICQ